MRRGRAGLSKWWALVAEVDEAQAIRVSSAREYGARQEVRGEMRLSARTRVDESDCQWRRGVSDKGEMLIVAAGRAQGGTPRAGSKELVCEVTTRASC